MERKAGKYALVQFCPVPERMEFLNIGIVLIVPELDFVGVKLSRSNARIDRVFGRQPKSYLDALKESFEYRLRSEFSGQFDEEHIASFARKRANDIRISAIQPVMVDDPDAVLEALFLELVGREAEVSREPRIRRKLKEAFARHGVEHYLEKPDEIELPEYGLKINAPYGYQNGCYNLVDGMRISESVADGLREVGKKAIEGNLLWKHFEGNQSDCKRLIVVGDFSQQSNAFYHAVDEQFRDANMKLFRLDDLLPLVHDIESNAALHS
ncbi:DUF3037 domain-containing protein [Sphingopyxis sp. NFH-91]|uniref:DUF3037 domain-containing protein n=1 Tax=Sphingopyxis sp. NFH-91 TaxID=2744457 RepID=UPI001F234E95|nr:DUF3037 domain-containing protein [Sphingopyxis sp. NFH-91]